jgi:aminoglycoside 2'-N-acetyltransferase I
MPILETAHTSELAAPRLAAIRSLMYAVFDDMTEHDWEHALGGVHAVVWEDEAPIAHAAVVMRRLVHGGRALRAGYVEAVAVRPDRRGEGLGRRVMEAIEPVLRGGYDLGALASSDEAVTFYPRLGWRAWRGPTFALTPDGVVRTGDADGAIFVLPLAAPLDLAGELTCDWRDGDVW